MVPYDEERFYVGTPLGGIRRYWMDGTWDSVYPIPDPKTGDGQALDYHVFPDGRMLIVGNFSLHDTLRGFTAMDYGLVWLNNDGSLDTTRIHRRINLFGAIWRIQELPDGKFICGGGGGLFEGDSISDFLFRIHADGSLDTTFHAPWIDYGYVSKIHPVSDGKILVSGVFHIAGDPDTLGLVRLLHNGSLDPTFQNHLDLRCTYAPGFVTSQGFVSDILPFGASTMVITGTFDQIDGQTRGGIAMLDTAGYLLPGYFEGNGCGLWNDPMPIAGIGPYKHIKGIEPAQDGGYFIYGSYSGYDDGTTNDPTQRFISRLHGLNVGIPENGAATNTPLSIAPNPSTGATLFSVGNALAKAELYIHEGSGRLVWQATWPMGAERYTLPAGVLAPGAYVVKVAAALRVPQGTTAPAGSAARDPAGGYVGRLVVMP